jgi:hypothetical protein
MPMFGDVPVSPKIQQLNDQFIKETIAETGSREASIKNGLELAWRHYHAKEPKIAMKRFNC